MLAVIFNEESFSRLKNEREELDEWIDNPFLSENDEQQEHYDVQHRHDDKCPCHAHERTDSHRDSNGHKDADGEHEEEKHHEKDERRKYAHTFICGVELHVLRLCSHPILDGIKESGYNFNVLVGRNHD